MHRRKDGTAQIVSINGRDGRWWGTEGRRAPLGKSYPRSMLIVVDSTVPHDTAVLRAYMPYARRVHRYLDERLTEALDDLPVEGTTRGETAIGNLIADAVRQQAGTDIAFAAADLVNAGIQKGVVRVRDAYRVLGSCTRQHIVVAKVPGSLLREVLHRAITRARVRLQVSGLRINGDQILVNGDPLDRDRCYTVAAAAHIVQDYFWGATVGILSDDVAAATVRDAFITYLRAHAPLRNITEGRISHITGNTLSIGGGQ